MSTGTPRGKKKEIMREIDVGGDDLTSSDTAGRV